MSETAKTLASHMLKKTIVLTGAMIPYKFGSSDGLFNLGCALAFLVPSLSPSQGGIAIFALILGYCYLCFWLFSNHNIWLELFGPVFTLFIGYLGITVYNYIQEEKNKQFLKESFGTYVSPELIDQMYESKAVSYTHLTLPTKRIV